MSKNEFDFDFDLPEEEEGGKPFSFNDLDLGLDFDLSFLDDIEEPAQAPVSQAKPQPKKEAPKPEPEEKKPVRKAKKPVAPVEEAAPVKKAKKPAAPAGAEAAPVKKARKAPAEGEAPVVKKPRKPLTPDDEIPAEVPGKKPVKKAPADGEAPKKTKKAEAPKKPAKKGPRIGGVIFYTLYFMFILVFFVATYFGMDWLKDWLVDYEASQPTVKAQQVFDEVFTSPDWGALYDAAGAQDSPYEGKEEYVNYMEAKVGGTPLTYLETSNGLSKAKKFLVYLADEKIASFTLVDKNNVEKLDLNNVTSLEDLESMTDIPDWQLGAVEVFFVREGDYYIEKLDGHIAYVNGVALDDKMTIQIATTAAKDYLPDGTAGFSMTTQKVSGLMEMPDVTVTDKEGNPIDVTYDETKRTFTARTESNTMTQEEQDRALEAAKIYSLWMIDEEHDRGEVAKYFDPTSDAYNRIVKTTELWMQNHGGYEFLDMSVTDYARYSDDIYSVRVKLNLRVNRINGDPKDHPFDQSMFFRKTDSGKWLCFESTNVNVSQPVGLVRLTFMNGQTELHTDFFDTNKSEIVTPVVSVPDGQVFSGWATISKDASGATVYNLEFQPDPTTGKVAIPDGMALKPMTLYAVFEDASAVAAQAETAQTPAPETDPAETAAPTEAAVVESTQGA